MTTKKVKLAKLITDLLVKSEAGLEVLGEFTYHPYRFIYKSLLGEIAVKESNLRSNLSRMQRRGLIEKKRVGKEILFRLSERGRLEFLKKKVAETKVNGKTMVLVIFDIPESERKIRNKLRFYLREFEFKPLQKSVWANQRDCFDLMREVLKLTELEEKVILVQTDKYYFK